MFFAVACRELCRIGPLFCQLDGQLRDLLAARGAAGAADAFTAAAVSYGTVLWVTFYARWDAEAAASVLTGARLLLNSGRLMLTAALRGGDSGTLVRRLVVSHLHAGSAAARLLCHRKRAEDLQHTAAATFAPGSTTAWLQALADGVRQTLDAMGIAPDVPPSKGVLRLARHATLPWWPISWHAKGSNLSVEALPPAGAHHHMHLLSFFGLTCKVLLANEPPPDFSALHAAVASHATLPRSIVWLEARHGLPAAVATLEAIPAGSPAVDAGWEAWELAMSAVELLHADCLEAAVRAHLQQNVPRVRDWAERLLAALPTCCPEEELLKLFSAWQAGLGLLNLALGEPQAAAHQPRRPAEREEQEAAWSALQALPHIAAALPTLMALGTSGILPPLILGLLVHAIKVRRFSTPAQLQLLLHAGDAALRMAALLQPPAPPEPGLQGEAAPEQQEEGSAAARQACFMLWQVAIHLLKAAAQAAPAEAASLAAAVPMAFRLYSNSCRAVHRWAATAGQEGVPDLDSLRDPLVVLAAAACTLARRAVSANQMVHETAARCA